MSGWVVPALWIAAFLVAYLGIAWAINERKLRSLGVSRPNPTREEFIAMMRPDVSKAASTFLWETVLFYLTPHATPHPDDNLFSDLPIDHDDITLDWPRDWCGQQGLEEADLPDWPEDWPSTIRNFGRWLDFADSPDSNLV